MDIPVSQPHNVQYHYLQVIQLLLILIDRIFITKKTQKPYMKKKYKRRPLDKNYSAKTRTWPLGREITNQKVVLISKG